MSSRINGPGGPSYGHTEWSDSPIATVQLGENSLAQVAKRLGMDPDALIEANPQIADPTKLMIGQEVHLPLCQKPAATAAEVFEKQPRSYPPPIGDPIAKSVAKAKLNANAVFEKTIKAVYGEEGLRSYKEMQRELAAAHQDYASTGKVPESQRFAPIEIKTGKPMSRADRYDAMLKKQGHDPANLDTRDVDIDPEYLTRDDFYAEKLERAKKQSADCADKYILPGKIQRCQREVKEAAYPDEVKAADENLRRQWNGGQYIEAVKNGGAGSLIGRVIGRAIGGEKGEQVGAVVGGVGDAFAQTYGARAGMPYATSNSGPSSGKQPAAAAARPPAKHEAETKPDGRPGATGGASGPPRDPRLFPNLTDKEVGSAIEGATGGQGFRLPGQHPTKKEIGLQEVHPSESRGRIAHQDRLEIKDVAGAGGKPSEVRRHSANPGAPAGSQSSTEPTTQVNTVKTDAAGNPRVSADGRTRSDKYMDADGKFIRPSTDEQWKSVHHK